MRYFIFLLAFLPTLIIGQERDPVVLYFLKNIDAEILNQEKSKVAQNGRLELGVSLPDSILSEIQVYMDGEPNQRKGLNPFLSSDIDVKARFIHKDEAEDFTAIGFWYTDIERNRQDNKWNQLKTNQQFRVRFAPPAIGEWEVFCEVSIRGKVVYSTTAISFTVVASDFKGYVTLNDTTQYLERDGKTIIPTGINLPFPSNKNNLMYSLDKDETLDLAAWEEYSTLIKDYILEGGEYFRFFMHPSATDIEFEEVGYYQDRQHLAWEMDQMISLCEETNTLIQFNLMYHSYFMKLGDYHQFRYDYANYWLDPAAWPYKDPNLPSGYSVMLDSKTPSDMFFNEKSMRFLKERTRYIMARWGYSTSLSAIELLCEPWHMNENSYAGEAPYDEVSESGDIARKAVYKYHKQMASYIKDSIGYDKHVLAAVGRFPVGSTGIYSHFTKETPNYVDSTWYLDDIDLISISYYSRSPEKLIYSKSSANNKVGEEENSMAGVINRLKSVYHKPVIFGESDHGDGSHQCSAYEGHKIDVMRYPFTGAIGHFIWSAYTLSDEVGRNGSIRDERVSWPSILSAKDYYNSNWFLNLSNNVAEFGREKSSFASSEKDIVEHQYMISNNQDIAAGYVYNRTFNIHTSSIVGKENLKENTCDLIDENYKIPIEISWRPNRLKVDGLKRMSKYRVMFYGYSNQSLLLYTEIRTSVLGKLKLTHPLLVPERSKTPLLWYKIEKLN